MGGCIDHGLVGNKAGYGATTRIVEGKKRGFLMHRLIYCEHNNLHIDDITGKVVRHTCDNSRCVNPAHLLLGTQLDNIQDMKDRGRYKAGENNSMAKLSQDDAEEIRRLYALGGTSTYKLAALFGVGQYCIRQILSGNSYKGGNGGEAKSTV